jgi:tetratricopeptide (TPR) repeat protein
LLYYIGAIVTLTLGLLAKPAAVVLPVLLLLLDWWPLNRNVSLARRLFEKVPFVFVVGAVAVAAVWAQSEGGGLKSLADYPLGARVSTVLAGYMIYFGKLFFPTGQGIFYPYQLYQAGIDAGAASLLILISFIAFKFRFSKPYLLFGWIWFLVALLPVIGIVQIGGQRYADRWSYLPHVGLLVAVLCLAQDTLSTRQLKIFGCGSILFFGSLTQLQLPNWRDSVSIFRHTIRVAPENFMAEMNLGMALQAKGEHAEAIKHLERATILRPFYPDGLNNLAIAKLKAGQVSEAEILLRRALAVYPGFVAARGNLVQLLIDHRFLSAALKEAILGLPYGDPRIERQFIYLSNQDCQVLSPVTEQSINNLKQLAPKTWLNAAMEKLASCVT